MDTDYFCLHKLPAVSIHDSPYDGVACFLLHLADFYKWHLIDKGISSKCHLNDYLINWVIILITALFIACIGFKGLTQLVSLFALISDIRSNSFLFFN